MIQIHVSFMQGLVKVFVAAPETRLQDFARVIRSYGKARAMRLQRDLSPDDAGRLVASGNAVMITVKRPGE